MSEFEAIEDLWSHMGHFNEIPYRSDIDLKALDALKTVPLLLEITTESDFRVRHAPFSLHKLFGGEIRGRNFLSFIEPFHREKALNICQTVAKGHQSAQMQLRHDKHLLFGGMYPVRTETGAIQYLFTIIDLTHVPETLEEPFGALRLVENRFQQLNPNEGYATQSIQQENVGFAEGRRLFSAKPIMVAKNRSGARKAVTRTSPFQVIGRQIKREP